MDAGIGILLNIQDKDQRLSGLLRVIAAAPADQAAAGQELRAAEAAAEAAKQAVFDIEKAVKVIEMDIQGEKAKIANLQNKSAMIRNNDEYRTAMLEISNHEKAIRAHEDRELELWEQVEGAKERRKEADKRLKEAQGRHQGLLKDLATRVANCRAEVDKVRAERADLAQRLPPELLGRYERLIARTMAQNNFRPVVAEFDQESCGVCHLKLPPMARADARRDGHTTCSHCGGILFHYS